MAEAKAHWIAASQHAASRNDVCGHTASKQSFSLS